MQRTTKRLAAAGMLTGLAVLGACAAQEMPGPGEGARLYAQHCAACHGASGEGDGRLADRLATRPADLTTIAARNGGQLPRAQVMSTIDGYHAAELGGREMPEFGLLLEGDLVPVDTGDGTMTPTPRPLAALLAYLATIQRG